MAGRLELLTNVATIAAGLSAIAVAAAVVMPRTSERRASGSSDEPRFVRDWRQYADVGHRLGPPDAATTIVEFGDYECPSCRGWYPHIEAILRKYPRDVGFVYRHWPLSYHRYAYPAARAAECAGAQGGFWEFHRQLYTVDNWLGDAMTEFARNAGVRDLVQFHTCMRDTARVAVIEADIAAAQELGATGTPTVIVNGLILTGQRDSLILDSLIVEAKRRVGTR